MSEMPGQRELLNICFACLRYSRVAQTGLPLVKPANLSNVFLRGGTQCSHCRFASSSSQGSAGVEEAQGIQADVIENNPFYEKYKQKLQHLATTEPDDFKWRLQQLEEQKKPKPPPPTPSKSADVTPGTAASPQPIPRYASYSPAKGLDSVMKLELVQDKSAEEVEQIWKEYHRSKDCVFATLQRDAYEDLMAKAQSCPTFIYPMPRNDGFEFILMQFDGKDVQFTPLAMYQILKENAPACLTLVHYTDLLESKGVVLMSGQYDDNVLKREEAVLLVQMMAIYFGKNSTRFDRVQTFNHHPDKFDYNQLIGEYKALYLDQPLPKHSESAIDKTQ